MKKIIPLILLFNLVSIIACADEDRPIAMNQLPQEAQTFISTYFGQAQPAFAKIDRDFLNKDYEVIFVDGTQLKFNGKGIWTKIDCQRNPVPSVLVPQQVAAAVARTWNAFFITEMEKDGKFFDITLSNGMEITFDSNYNMIDYDN